MRRLVTYLNVAFVIGAAARAGAQSAAMKPFELNMDRVKISKFGGNLGDTKTYFVPTYDLVVSMKGSVWAKKGGAQAHGSFFVDGMDADLMRGLATKLYDDLVTRMRAAGYTVLTYDDMKGEPDVVKRGRDKPDARWGFPTRNRTPLHYIIASPSAEQQFDNPIQGSGWPWRGIAKEKGLMAISPEISFSLPQMWGVGREGYSTNEAGIATDPAMVFEGADVRAINGKGGSVTIFVQRHDKRLAAESAGTIRKLSESKMEIASLWNRTSGDFSMTIDPETFSDGILRVGLAMNTLILAEIAKAHK